MASQRGVVGLHVALEVVVQTVVLQKADNGLNIVVVLVLHGLTRFRLNQQLKLRAQRCYPAHA